MQQLSFSTESYQPLYNSNLILIWWIIFSCCAVSKYRVSPRLIYTLHVINAILNISIIDSLSLGTTYISYPKSTYSIKGRKNLSGVTELGPSATTPSSSLFFNI